MDLPRGERIISEKIANLEAVYKKLPEDFRGVIRIFMKFEGRLYRGDMLIDDGNILGVSLDDLDKSISSYGERALEEIKNKASKSIGDVDVYKFSEIEMSLAIDSNERILFRRAIPLDRLGVERVVVEEERKKEEEESIEKWREELGKLNEEWARLEEKWKKLESIKDLPVESIKDLPVEQEAGKKAEELAGEDLEVLKSRPKMLKGIGFTDKLRLLKFPRASNVMKLMDGKKTVEEIAEELNIDKRSIIGLMKELKKRSYI
ncbi:MAG: hypothetical protein DRO89_05130, partial [Candidatus Altiarchaeales archaeon]